MASFEIRVNGETRFADEYVRAITFVADSESGVERIYVHIGVGDADQVQYLGGDLRAGDEISIRVLADKEDFEAIRVIRQDCSFCGSNRAGVRSLASDAQVSICDGCLAGFQAVITRGASLPIGASIVEGAEHCCSFCLKSPP